MQPNWYDDPWSPATLRWWDGAQWTAHVAARPHGWWPQGEPRPTAADIAQARAWGQRASITVVVQALFVCGQFFFAATLVHQFLHDLFHQIDVQNRAFDADPNAPISIHAHFGNLAWIYGLGLLNFVAEIFLMIWLWRSAKIARGLGLRQRRDPMWAFLGFIVPVVNLWFPLVVALDLFQAGDPERRHAGWWWGFYLGQGIVTVPLIVVSFASTVAAVVLAALACVVPLGCAYRARQMIAAVTARQATIA